ncbi:MAG TPA: polymer-forming cytoskeletal protein [Myxococcota bacterium]|nr:polymer-forming cytoskeletal protein [Myxococcota bacterium]
MTKPSPHTPPEPPVGEPATCAVGAGSRFDGLLSFWGAARVEGTLRGEVAAQGRLEVGPEARVVARIHVDALVIEGEVVGEVVVRRRLEVRRGARVRGSIQTPRLALSEGAVLEGSLVMGEVDGGRALPVAPDAAATVVSRRAAG